MDIERRNAVMLHGSHAGSNSYWFPYVREKLEGRGYSVSVPQLPDPESPSLDLWLPIALREDYLSETILVAHSVGSALALSVLENIKNRIRLAVLVAGYSTPLPGLEAETRPTVQTSYNWARISQNVGDLFLIHSDNDPWGCDDQQGRAILDNIGKGSLIIRKGEGHMGSDLFNQPYPCFPLLLGLVDSPNLQYEKSNP